MCCAGDGSRVWSHQAPLPGEDIPRGNKMLHVHQPIGNIYLVATNSLMPTVLTVIKISQQGSAPPTHATLDLNLATIVPQASLTTTTSSKLAVVAGVVVTQQALGQLWITGQTMKVVTVQASTQTVPEGTFIIQVGYHCGGAAMLTEWRRAAACSCTCKLAGTQE
jgi:hypothetical protein